MARARRLHRISLFEPEIEEEHFLLSRIPMIDYRADQCHVRVIARASIFVSGKSRSERPKDRRHPRSFRYETKASRLSRACESRPCELRTPKISNNTSALSTFNSPVSTSDFQLPTCDSLTCGLACAFNPRLHAAAE